MADSLAQSAGGKGTVQHTAYQNYVLACLLYMMVLSCRILKQVMYAITAVISGPSTVVGIATAYGLDGPGIESRCGRDFPHQSRPALRPNRLPYNWYRVFPENKMRPGRDADPSPPSSAEVKK